MLIQKWGLVSSTKYFGASVEDDLWIFQILCPVIRTPHGFANIHAAIEFRRSDIKTQAYQD